MIKKQVKVLSIVLMVIMVLTSLASIVCAGNTDLSGQIEKIGKGNGKDYDKVIGMGQAIVTIMQTVGIVVAVVVLLVLGIKYMMGSAEEKAEYKKTMIPYIVGAILIFASTTIVNVVYQLANGFNS